MTSKIDPFHDIRPYNDEEVRPVIDGLVTNKELLDVLGRYKFPPLKVCFGPLNKSADPMGTQTRV